MLALEATLVADVNQEPELYAFEGVALGNELYFANKDALGSELWTSDGSPEGTARLIDIRAGEEGSAPDDFLKTSDLVYFTADDGDHGRQLWRSDGTPKGTFLLTTNIITGGRLLPRSFQVVGRILFFVVEDERGSLGTGRLWMSDGTVEGTVPFFETHSLPSGTVAAMPTVFNGLLFVGVMGSAETRGLWKTDGTLEGTSKVETFWFPWRAELRSHPGSVTFSAKATPGGSFELWQTDGTPEGTSTTQEALDSFNSNQRLGDYYYFSKQTPGEGYELWRTNGTRDEGSLFLDIESGEQGSSPEGFVHVGSSIFFTATTAALGQELWVTDGTLVGTHPIDDFAAGTSSSLARSLIGGDELLYFIAAGADGRSFLRRIDTRDWSKHSVLELPLSNYGSNLTQLGIVDGEVILANAWWGGAELWRSDGTTANTKQIQDSLLPYPFAWLASDALLLYSRYQEDTGTELWLFDPTSEESALVKDINPEHQEGTPGGAMSSFPRSFAAHGGFMYFLADSDGNSEYELWQSNGKEEGTVMVADISSVGSSWYSDAPEVASVGGKLILVVDSSGIGYEPWMSDGTLEGTFLLRDIAPGSESSSPREFVELDGRILFSASDGVAGDELWITDGSAEGTRLLKDVHAGERGSFIGGLTTAGSLAFFSADGGVGGQELWRTDGTTEGTWQVADVFVGRTGSNPQVLWQNGGVVYFSADDGTHGRELWKSDGTQSGTRLVADLLDGAESSDPAVVGRGLSGSVFLSVDDGVHGRELWIAERNASGIRRLTDVNPLKEDADPAEAVLLQGAVLFRADDGLRGQELWTLDPPPGDTNFDGLVDLVDFTRLKKNFGREEPNLAGDLNYDDVVDLADFAILKEHFGYGGGEPASGETADEIAVAAAFDAALLDAADDEESR